MLCLVVSRLKDIRQHHVTQSWGCTYPLSVSSRIGSQAMKVGRLLLQSSVGLGTVSGQKAAR